MAVRPAFILVATLSIALFAGACDLLGGDVLPVDRAVDLALDEAGGPVDEVLSVEFTTFRDAGLEGVGGIAGNRPVWIVVLGGSFQGSCGPVPRNGNPPRECAPPASRKTIVLDGRTGEWLVSSASR
jgi:hypothetical protein